MSNWGLAIPGGVSAFVAASTIVPGNSTPGSWVTVSSAAPANVVGVVLQKRGYNANFPTAIDVGIGAVGFETIIAEKLLVANTDATSSSWDMHLPVTVPEGVRVALRIAGVGGAGTAYVGVQFVLGAGLYPVAGTRIATHGIEGDYTGTAVTSGSGANVLGTRVEFVASLDERARGFGIALHGDQDGNSYRGNVGVFDASGVELATRVLINTGGTTSNHGLPFLMFRPCSFPKGSSLYLATSNDATGTPTRRGFILYTVH